MAQAATLLMQGARTEQVADARARFESAGCLEPTRTLPWLWLATLEANDEGADALIERALDLDLGPPPWRTAAGELLMALALRRRARHPTRALDLLIEASYALPHDSRVWLAMAATTTSAATRVTCLERAHDLRSLDHARIRAQLLSAAVASALALLRDGRTAPAYETMLRAVAVAPRDARVWVVASRLAPSTFEAKDVLQRAVALNHEDQSFCAELRAGPQWPDEWGVRVAPVVMRGDDSICASLVELELALRPSPCLLAEYTAPRAEAELLRSAVRWTGRLAASDSRRDSAAP